MPEPMKAKTAPAAPAPKEATVAKPGPQSLGSQEDYGPNVKATNDAPWTDAEKDQKKAQTEATKIEMEAAEKAGKINAHLIRDGDPRRVQGGVRNGEPKYFWGNFVPTKELTDEELKAVEAM